MKKITLMLILIAFAFAGHAQNPFDNNFYTYNSTASTGGTGGQTGLQFSGHVDITVLPGTNEFTISDITGGLYEQGYSSGAPNPAVVTVNTTNQTLTITNQPDTVYGNDVFNGTGTYTTDTNGDVVSFVLTWSNGYGDSGTTTFNLFTGTQAPGEVINPTPADQAVNVSLNTADNNGDGNPDMSVTFSWDAATTGGAATSYDFYIATDLNSLGTPLTTASSTSITINGFSYGTTYYWKVVATNPIGNATATTWSFTTEQSTVAAPGIVTNPTPANGATGVDVDPADDNGDGNPDMSVAFAWNAPTSGDPTTSYDFYLSDPSSSDPTQLNLIGSTPNTSVNVTGMTYGDTYYWMVIATNAGGDAVGSSTWSFTTENSVVLPGIVTNPTPANGATGVDVDPADNNGDGTPDMAVDFDWNAPTTGGVATSYDFYLSDPDSNDPTQLQLFGSVNTPGGTATGLSYGKTYYWQVVATNASGDAVGSTTWSFTTEADPTAVPDVALNPIPANGATNVQLQSTTSNGNPTLGLLLEWDEPTTGGNVDGYEVYIGSDPNNLNHLNNPVTDNSIYLVNYSYSTTYYWRIIPYNNNGEATGIITWSFTTEADPNAPGVATNPTPADGATNVEIINTTNTNGNPAEAVNLSWDPPTPGGAISSYDVYWGLSPNNMSLVGSTTNTSYEALNPNYSTTYYWAIVTYNDSGSFSTSEIWSFSTEDQMSVTDIKQEVFTHYINNGQLHIEANSSMESVQLYSILGQQVASQKLSNNKENIDISHLQAGIYLAQVQVEGKTKTFKFVKK